MKSEASEQSLACILFSSLDCNEQIRIDDKGGKNTSLAESYITSISLIVNILIIKCDYHTQQFSKNKLYLAATNLCYDVHIDYRCHESQVHN